MTNLVGISAPKKKNLAPPPKFPADTLRPFAAPPPVLGISIENPTSAPSWRHGLLLPLPRAEKKTKKYPKRPPIHSLLCVRFFCVDTGLQHLWLLFCALVVKVLLQIYLLWMPLPLARPRWCYRISPEDLSPSEKHSSEPWEVAHLRLRPERPFTGVSGPSGPRIAKKSQKESFWGSAKKSPKIPEKVKKYTKLDFLVYFLTFSGIFGNFFADPQKDSFWDFFAIRDSCKWSLGSQT